MEEKPRGVSQRSILVQIILEIFINVIFLFITNLCLTNYVEHNILHAFGKDHNKMKMKLSKDFQNLQYWYKLE